MSYIAFDLDALNVVPSVAAAAGVRTGDVSHGLLLLWAYCFREEVDVVGDVHVRGFFGADVAPALEAFGFLERMESGWRVKGAARYLRVREAQREGGREGRARSTSKVGRTSRTTTRSTSGSTLRSTSGSTSGSAQALTPSTEHRAPNTESEALPPAAPPAPARVASDALCADFKAATGAEYLWAGAKDGAALAALLKAAPLEEVRARWRRGLAAEGWRLTRTVADLRRKWNDLATDGPPKDVTRGFAEPSEWGTEPGSREVAL